MQTCMIGMDLDGTLLTSDKTITLRTQQLLEMAARNGHILVAVTGRPLFGIPECVRKQKAIRYYITSNGAVIYAADRDRILFHNALPAAACRTIYEKLAEKSSVFEIFAGGKAYESRESYANLKARYHGAQYREYIQNSRMAVADMEQFLYENITVADEISVMFDKKEEVPERIFRELQCTLPIKVVETYENEYELYDVHAGKGTVLNQLAQKLGMSRAQIIAIGDGNNDVEMLQQAGHAVAMENAAVAVKQAADMVTAANDADGVAEILQKVLDGTMELTGKS